MKDVSPLIYKLLGHRVEIRSGELTTQAGVGLLGRSEIQSKSRWFVSTLC